MVVQATLKLQPIFPRKDPFARLSIAKLKSIQKDMENFKDEALEALKNYPPPHRYKRTYRLKNHWRAPRRGVEGWVIYNNMPYAPLVQGPRRTQRALFRRYGWFSVSNVRTQIWPKYRARILQKMGITRLPVRTTATTILEQEFGGTPFI